MGRVDIVATTLAGESPTGHAPTRSPTSAARCRSWSARSSAPAKSSLRGGGCQVGKVTKVKAPAKKHGKVISQNAKAGRVLSPGAKIAIKLV